MCKDCANRDKSGWCKVLEQFVPRKQTKDGKDFSKECGKWRKR